MPLGRFSVLTFLGCLPWCFGAGRDRRHAGNNWEQWEQRLGYLNYLIVAAWWFWRACGYCGDGAAVAV